MSFPPVEPEYGDDCAVCYAAGLTPKWFYVFFSGIKIGQLWFPALGTPPNMMIAMHQWGVQICKWGKDYGAGRLVRYNLNVAGTVLFYEAAPAKQAFSAVTGVTCVKHFTNSYNVFAGNFFYGGEAVVMPAWEVADYVEIYTPIVDPDPQLSLFPVPGNRAVIRYTDSWGDTNFSMLVDI